MGERVTWGEREWRMQDYKQYLCLDLGTSTGWATLRVNDVGNWEVSEYGTENLKGDDGERFRMFHGWLEGLLCGGAFDGVYYEAPHGRSVGRAAAVLGGLRGVLLLHAFPHGLPIVPVAVGSWKKVAVGKGNASKEQVMEAVLDMGYSPETQDEADAIGIAVSVGRNAPSA